MASLQEQLWDGAWSGDLLKVKQAVAAGINVDAVIYDSNHVSGLTGRVAVCCWLRVFGGRVIGMDVRDQVVTHGWWP